MKEIILGNNLTAQVDDDDYIYLNQWKWYIHKSRTSQYAARRITIKGIRKRIFMHNVIMNPRKGVKVEHININGLDNQRSNLRFATHAQNCINYHRTNKTGYRGVSYDKKNNMFRARISINDRRKHLGYFNNPIEAAKKHDHAALKYQGEFAIINF